MNMKIKHLLLLTLIPLVLSSCLRRAYFLNPLHGNNQPYRSLPMVSDSSHHAAYAHGSFSAGGANDQLSDGVVSLQGSVYQAHTFQNVQLYYGVTGTIGNYHMNTHHHYNDVPNSDYLKSLDGDNFFGAAGGIGGFDFVVPFASGSEWRVFGIEGSVLKEFGDYLSVRRSIPDSAVSGIDRNDVHGSLSFGTNIIKRFRRSGNAFGFKLAYVVGTNRVREYIDGGYISSFRPGFLSSTFHFTANRITGFGQFNFGHYVANVQFGVNYRLY
jgi:hypothetical protein